MATQWRIQEFPTGGGGEEGSPTPNVGLFCKLFAENCMKMKNLDVRGDGREEGDPAIPRANGVLPVVYIYAVADLGFPRGGGANSPGGGANIQFRQNFPKTA